MKVRYYFACALVSAVAPAAHAYLIGNPLVPRDEPSDLGSYVYNVYYATPMPSAGTVDAISIYQMDTSNLPEICDSFTLRFLHYTGIGQLYDQYYTSRVFGIYGPMDAVQTYLLNEDVQVEAGDLFVTYGQAIPFSNDPASPDTYYFTGFDFAPADTGVIDLSNITYTGNRDYSAAVNFTPAGGSSVTVPEPGVGVLLTLGVMGAAALRRRRG